MLFHISVAGELEGDAIFYYPDESQLQGKWSQDRLVAATFTSVEGENSDIVYTRDESSDTVLALAPTRRDPYTAQYTYAGYVPTVSQGMSYFALLGHQLFLMLEKDFLLKRTYQLVKREHRDPLLLKFLSWS